MSKLNGLSSVERRIFDLLVSHLPKVRPGHGPSYLGYQEVHDILGLTLHGPTPGISLQVQGLETLANLLRDAGVPALTGIVIDKTKGWPSSGYFRVHQRKPMDFQFWMDHTAAAKRFDWAHWIATDNGQVIITDAPSTEWVLQIRWSEGVSETVDLQGVDEQGVWISTSESWENSQLPRATVKYRVFAHRHIDGGKVMFKLDYFRDQQHDQLPLEYGRWGQTLIVLSEDGEGYAQWHDGSDKEFSTSALAVTVVERLTEMPAHRAVIKNSTTLTKFLDSLGCRLRIGWYWSAASEDKRRVIFTVWADQIKNGCYTLLPNEEVSWGRLPGAYELRRHLPLSQVPDTEVYGVICKAVDEHAATREREYFNEYELVRLSIEQRDGAWVALLDDMVDVEHLRAGPRDPFAGSIPSGTHLGSRPRGILDSFGHPVQKRDQLCCTEPSRRSFAKSASR